MNMCEYIKGGLLDPYELFYNSATCQLCDAQCLNYMFDMEVYLMRSV